MMMTEQSRKHWQLARKTGERRVRQTDWLPEFEWIGESIYEASLAAPCRSKFILASGKIGFVYLSRTDRSGSIILNREFPDIVRMQTFTSTGKEVSGPPARIKSYT
jgi:hypothetical protein